MKRYAAKYVYPLTSPEPVVNGFVEVEDDGTILRKIPRRSPSSSPVPSSPALSMPIATSSSPT